jgi:hypothetical protein
MPKITIYNDSDADLDADFDVVELMGGKEVARTTIEPDDSTSHAFRIYASNQAFLILPRGVKCPRVIAPARGTMIDARKRGAKS